MMVLLKYQGTGVFLGTLDMEVLGNAMDAQAVVLPGFPKES